MLKILIIDDDSQNRDLAMRILKRQGYDVLHVADGETGVMMAEADAPDLILMDLAMPDMDGFETARRIKSGRQTGDIPIIAVTAYAAREATQERAKDAGCDDFDTKPIDSGRLLAKIKTLLDDTT